MQITKADKKKRLLSLALWWFKHKYKKGDGTDAEIADDMAHCGNPVIRLVYNEVMGGLNKIDDRAGHQKKLTKELATFILWILYRDTAYRQPTFYILKNILDKKEEIEKHLDKYYVKPEHWYANKWVKAKDDSKKAVENGDIAEGDFSPSETYFIPEVQAARFDEIDKELMKKKKTRQMLMRD